MPEIAGRQFEVVVGSDVSDRDGMFLELYDAETNVLEVFYSDLDGSMTFTAYQHDLPVAVVEWAVAEAKIRLTPTAD